MTDFVARLERQVQEHGPLCIGIDPSAASLSACGFPDSAEGALAFGRRLLQAVNYELAIVKPQAAYFERFGSEGMRALEQLAAEARAKEVLVLLDAKRGDIGPTGEAYAEAYLSASAPLRVDAITMSPYLGLGALEKGIAFAHHNGGGVFIVVRSSNPEGECIQTARQASGVTVADTLCREITALNRRLSELALGPVGAVVGATCWDASPTVEKLPRSYILAPGVGTQGATIADIRERMPQALGRVLPSVSRGVLANGPSAVEVAAVIRELQRSARKLLQRDVA